MNFQLFSTTTFGKQLLELNDKEKQRVKEKLLLIKQNPFRNKAVHSKEFSLAFRIRINLQDKEKRILYAVAKDKIIVAGILDRDKDYKDLEVYLKKAKGEVL